MEPAFALPVSCARCISIVMRDMRSRADNSLEDSDKATIELIKNDLAVRPSRAALRLWRSVHLCVSDEEIMLPHFSLDQCRPVHCRSEASLASCAHGGRVRGDSGARVVGVRGLLVLFGSEARSGCDRIDAEPNAFWPRPLLRWRRMTWRILLHGLSFAQECANQGAIEYVRVRLPACVRERRCRRGTSWASHKVHDARIGRG